MDIYLIRHGATAGNLEKRYVGSTDEPLLQESRGKLKKDRGRYPIPQYVVTSPMKRCKETAALLFPGIASEVEGGLRECEFGRFEYKNYQELSQDEEYQRWIDSGGFLPFPDGESQATFQARSCRAFAKSVRRMAEQGFASVAYVVHGGTIMAVLERFCTTKKAYFDWQVRNGEGVALHMVYEPDTKSGEPEISLDLLRVLPVPEEERHRSGIEDVFVLQKNRRLQCGYTTGSCAAAAAKAAVWMLFEQQLCQEVMLLTPKGVKLVLETEFPNLEVNAASCAVRKFGGDDPDATDGLLIFARAELTGSEAKSDAAEDGAPEVIIDGGKGVGRVTKPGLEQPVGAAAINRVPRQMITQGVQEVCKAYGYSGTVCITISVQGGEEIAARTFNPHLGIVGGISILGTSGIVVPMSEQALIESIRVEMRQKVNNKEQYLLITPGNYGADFLKSRQQYEILRPEYSMKCSNYVGETLDMAVELGVKGILFVAHIGKFIKVSGGIMNTHSAHADCRAELMAAQAMRAGADCGTVTRLLAANTTEEAVGILKEAGYLDETIQETVQRIWFHLQKHCQGALRTEVVLFSSQYGYLGETDGVRDLMQVIAEEKNILLI